MADNNPNQDPNQDPFSHPIRRNNWWLYIFGGIVMAGIIIWFFIDWSYKDRPRESEEEQLKVEQALENPATPEIEETLPAVTVEEQSDSVVKDSAK